MNLYLPAEIQVTAAALAAERRMSVSQLVSTLVAGEKARSGNRIRHRQFLAGVKAQLERSGYGVEFTGDGNAVELLVVNEGVGIQPEIDAGSSISRTMLLQVITYSAAKFDLELVVLVVPDDATEELLRYFQALSQDALTVDVHVTKAAGLEAVLKGPRAD